MLFIAFPLIIGLVRKICFLGIGAVTIYPSPCSLELGLLCWSISEFRILTFLCFFPCCYWLALLGQGNKIGSQAINKAVSELEPLEVGSSGAQAVDKQMDAIEVELVSTEAIPAVEGLTELQARGSSTKASPVEGERSDASCTSLAPGGITGDWKFVSVYVKGFKIQKLCEKK